MLLFTVAALLLAAGLCLGTAEIICRLLKIPFPATTNPTENAVAQFDPELGWSYIPNRSVIQKYPPAARDVAVHFDDIGARVRAPGHRRDPAAPTVLFVGCSFTMGHGVLYEETVAGQLESTPHFPFQAVNLGVQGYGTDQVFLLLKRHFKKFNTKAVVYTYLGAHPVRNATDDPRLIYRQRNLNYVGSKPRFALATDGTVYLANRPVKFEARAYSRLRASLRYVAARHGPVVTPDLTRALIQAMKAFVESNGATFIVIDWQQTDLKIRRLSPCLEGLSVNLVDTRVQSPPGWWNWRIHPEDPHPDARAYHHVARLLLEEFKRLNLFFPHS